MTPPPDLNDPLRLLTVPQVAQLIQKSREFVRSTFRGVMISERGHRIPATEIAAWMKTLPRR